MIQPLFKETNNNGPTTVYKRQCLYSNSLFLSACLHPLQTITTTSATMNSEEEQRVLAPVDEDEDDDSTTPKPDDVPGPCTRKRSGVTRSEFDDL